MLLPDDVLRTISFYESSTLQKSSKDYRYYDYVTLHFKSWWKRSRKIKFQCRQTLGQNSDNYTVHTTDDFKELKEQLDTYFQNHEDDLRL